MLSALRLLWMHALVIMLTSACHRSPEEQLGPATVPPASTLVSHSEANASEPPKQVLPKPPLLSIWEKIHESRMDRGSPDTSIEITPSDPSFARWHTGTENQSGEKLLRIPGGGRICQPGCHLIIQSDRPIPVTFHESGRLTHTLDFVPTETADGDLHIYLPSKGYPNALQRLWLVRQGKSPVNGISFPVEIPPEGWITFDASSDWALIAGDKIFRGPSGPAAVPVGHLSKAVVRVEIQSQSTIKNVALQVPQQTTRKSKVTAKSLVVGIFGGLRTDIAMRAMDSYKSRGTTITTVAIPTLDVTQNLSTMLGKNVKIASQGGLKTILISSERRLSKSMAAAFDVVVQKRPLFKEAAEHMLREAQKQLNRFAESKVFMVIVIPEADPPHFKRNHYMEKMDPGYYRGALGYSHLSSFRLDQIKKGMFRMNSRDEKRLAALYESDVLHLNAQMKKRLAISPDTLLTITSTHGYELAEHGSVHFGHSLHRESVEVPAIFLGDGISENRSIDHACSANDVIPAGLSMVGVDTKGAGQLLANVVTQAVSPTHRPIRTKMSDSISALRYSRWRMIERSPFKRLIYDLNADPGEIKPIKMPKTELSSLLRDLSMLEKQRESL